MKTEVKFCGVCQLSTTNTIEVTATMVKSTCNQCHHFTTLNHPPMPKENTTWTISNMLNPREWKEEKK